MLLIYGVCHRRRFVTTPTRQLLLLFRTEDDLRAAERTLRGRRKLETLDLSASGSTLKYPAAARVVRVDRADQVQTRVRSAGRMARISLALRTEFLLHQRTKTALQSMNVRLPNVLSAWQDQVFVLDRKQRMVAFFGRWPKEAPWQLKDMLGKRKRDIFGPEDAAVHDAAVSRALLGEETVYEWSVTKAPRPIHLFTTASPLHNDDGKVAGVLLVTRNVTRLKDEQLALEAALKEKTSQLRELELGVKQIAATFQRSGQGPTIRQYGLSRREQEVLNLLRRGTRLRTVARTLGISIETARRHVKSMFRKTGVHSQEALVQMFWEHEGI
jgi:DNA-binding CsgD family transcriptional regulator/PAS domain-containing protein